MAVKLTGSYLGGLRVELRHPQSGSSIQTDAPLDNNGKGESFSPTDLAAASLGACMLTVMGIAAEKSGIEFGSPHFELEKQMATGPRRIASIPLTIHMPKSLTLAERAKLEAAGNNCPV